VLLAGEFPGGRHELEAALGDLAKPPRKPRPKQVRRAIDRASAERMAADLEGYDSQIVGGRLT
jgi:hypothetical protein